MERRGGQRRGTIHLDWQGHYYHRNGRYEDGQYNCAKRTTSRHCGVILIRDRHGEYHVRGVHNHASTPLCARRRQMINELQRLAIETDDNAEEKFLILSPGDESNESSRESSLDHLFLYNLLHFYNIFVILDSKEIKN